MIFVFDDDLADIVCLVLKIIFRKPLQYVHFQIIAYDNVLNIFWGYISLITFSYTTRLVCLLEKFDHISDSSFIE